MVAMQLHPGSEPLPEGGGALLQRLRTVLVAQYGDRPSTGWCVAVDTCRRFGEKVFSVVVWQESAGGQWLGEAFVHPGAPIERIAKRFEEWLAEREAPVPTLP